MGENTLNLRDPRLPNRMEQGDFFVCDIFDAAPKGDMASMEHPIFTLSTKPDRAIRNYENGGDFLKITPSVEGLATVHDRDLLIFCISQIISALNAGETVSHKVRFIAKDMLSATNRGDDGRAYQQLRAALVRLRGTVIETNITTGNREVLDGFGLIDSYRIVREHRDGRMMELEITLSDWVFSAINSREVLTYSPDYFRLRKPLERRIYEIARKFCGRKSEWKISLDKLHKRCGSRSSLFEFRRLVRNISNADFQHKHMPDYSVTLDDSDFVVFKSRGTVIGKKSKHAALGFLDSSDYEAARAVANGWDVYHIEGEWRQWCGEKELTPKRIGSHFVSFCKSWAEKRGRA